MKSSVYVGALLWMAAGCGEEVPSARPPSPEAPSDETVAVVDGRLVGVDAVRKELECVAGKDPRSALGALIRRSLLVQRARRALAADSAGLAAAVDRAAVRELLRDVVEQHEANPAVDEASLRDLYQNQQERFVQPESRTVSHLLFPLDQDAPESLVAAATQQATALLREMQRSPPGQVFDRFSGEGEADAPRREDLGTFSRDAPFVEPFLAAAFAPDAPGLVGAPVRTEFGVHLIWVQAVAPKTVVPFSAVRDQLAQEIIAREREQRLSALLQETRVRFAPVTDEGLLRTATLQDELP